MSYSTRIGSLSPEIVAHAQLGEEYGRQELIATNQSMEAAAWAGSAASLAATTTLNAAAARTDLDIHSARTLSQGRSAHSAALQERATSDVHDQSLLIASTAQSRLAQRTEEHDCAQSHLATAGAHLTAVAHQRDAACQRASDRDLNYITANAQLETANNVRKGAKASVEVQSARAATAEADATSARASERSAEAMAHEASVSASLAKSKAADAELQAAAAERRRADAAAHVASATATAREEEAKQITADAALKAAEEVLELARSEAVKARADAAAREEEAKKVAIQHNNLQMQAAAANRKVATEEAHAATAKTRLSSAQRDARIAAAEAHHAERDAAIQRAKLQVASVDTDVARGQVEDAAGSLRRSGRLLDSAKSSFLRATSQEAISRDVRNQASAHASVERSRQYSERCALSFAQEREAVAATAESTAIRTSWMAKSEATHAAAVHRSAAACQAAHSMSPRVVIASSLSPSRAHAVALLAATSPRGSAVDSKLRALGSPLASTPRSRFC